MSAPPGRTWKSLVAAVLLAIGQGCLLALLWGYISADTPLPRWLLTHGLKGTPLHAVVFLSDFLLNVVFSLPVAYAICRLKPPRLPTYLILAIVPGFIWQYRLLLTATPLLVPWTAFVPGVVIALAPLPLVALLLRRMIVHRAPNQRLERP
jgi:hypothetical protein